MAYNSEEYSKAFDIAIASNSKDAMTWVATHPLATSKHLEAIASKGKKIPLTLKCIVARHENLDEKSCDHFRDSDALDLATAIISNKSLDVEYRKTWLTEKVVKEAMKSFKNSDSSDTHGWRHRYWKRRFESFRAKLPEDVWPEFDNLVTVRDIIV